MTVFIFILCTLMFVSQAEAETTPSAVDFSRVNELISAEAYEKWFSGGLVVAQKDQLHAQHFQGTDGAGEQIDGETIFWLGSNSKMLTAAMVLQLAEEGKLRLEDPIGKHIPGWSETDLSKDGSACTVERLLSHQCGLPVNLPLNHYASLIDPIRREGIRETYLEYVRTVPLLFGPANGYQYSNLGYTLIALMILELDDGTFDEIAQRRLFQPLALTNSGFEPSRIEAFEKKASPLSVNIGGWSGKTSTWLGLDERSPSWLGAAGGGFSTPFEYAKLISALMSGPLLQPASRERLVRPIVSSNKDGALNYALGVGVEKIEGFTEYRHGGSAEPHGFSIHVRYLPALDLTSIVMSNRGVSVYDARDVTESIVFLMLGKPYKSPFVQDLSGWFSASAIGLVQLLVVPFLFASFLLTARRKNTKGSLSLATSLVLRGWLILFFRGLLGIHVGDGSVLWLSLLVIGAIVGVLAYRVAVQPTMLRFPPKSPWLGRARSWFFIVMSILLLLFFSVLVKLFVVHTVVLLLIVGVFPFIPKTSTAVSHEHVISPKEAVNPK